MEQKNNIRKDLTIKPVRVEIAEDKKWQQLDERLPVPPFLMVLQAPVASGKTTTIVNMLYNKNYYREMFDSVVIFSPTIHNDLTWKVALDDDTVTIYSDQELETIDETMEQLYNIQLDRVREAEENENSPPHMLMIIDDCLGLLGKKFNRLVTRHRHPRLSIMVSTQNFRALNLQIRQNASHYMIYRTNNNKELDKMTEEFAGAFGKQNFLDVYNQATAEPYSFLVLHQRTVKAYRRFEDLLYERHNVDVKDEKKKNK